MAESQGFYNADVSGERSLILSDLEQEMPASRCKVTDALMRQSNSGKQYPVLMLEDEDGNTYAVCAWQRDVRDCIKEWGGKNPKDWGYVGFKKTGNRYAIIPHPDQSIMEE